MERRSFLKGFGGAVGLGLFDLSEARAEARTLKIARTTETRSTCPYCSVSCGVIIHTMGDRAKNVVGSVVHVEGDPDHPINRGTLCPKGISLKQDIHHPGRLRTPKVRRAGSDQWAEISWDEAINGIAKHIKGETVNRTPGIGLIGGCTDTNEFNFLQWKLGAALGVTYRDTQARV